MRILFLSRWFPYPPNNGSKIRVLNVLRQLALEHDVTLLTFAEVTDRVDAETMDALRAHCSDVVVLPYRPYQPTSFRAVLAFLSTKPRFLIDTHSEAMGQAITREVRRNRIDLVMTSQLDMAPYASFAPDVTAVLEELELTHFAHAAGKGVVPHRRVRSTLTWMKLKGYLKRTLPRFSACTVVSDQEARLVRSIAPMSTEVRVIPNAVELSDYQGEYRNPTPGTMVYAGSVTYSANLDAVSYFLRFVYPLISRAVPESSLRVTGRTTEVALASLPSCPTVEFTGHLDDIKRLVAESWVSVVPLRVGGGSRLKILESMALGTPVVSTPKGAEGLEIVDGKNIAIANKPDLFADRTVELMRSPDLRSLLSLGGRELVESKYNWSFVGMDLRSLVDQVLVGGEGSRDAAR